ncbi:MAG: DNA-binding response regulator [Cytophagales bacterium]|nr:MAG: DNA-binding response regulator [Cytophagales bacterium]TAF62136.1 MAG: DNA-binding response regulator [Cytophagales bacterium]
MENSISPSILLTEDDDNLGILLKDYLGMKGYDVTLCQNGQEALKTYDKQSFDICLLDVMMPIMDGFTLAEHIRRKNKTIPIIFITAKSMKEDKLQGFEIGADDYIAKPFSMEELLMRIKAVLRRTTPASTNVIPNKYNIGKLAFDYDIQTLKTADKDIKLTSKEAELLKMLCDNKNQTLERAIALKTIWLDDNYFNARSMDVYITKLRKYLKADENIKLINVHGTGFKLVQIED